MLKILAVSMAVIGMCGLANVAIQVYLTAMVMNLKRLATLLCLFFSRLEDKKVHLTVFGLMESAF